MEDIQENIKQVVKKFPIQFSSDWDIHTLKLLLKALNVITEQLLIQRKNGLVQMLQDIEENEELEEIRSQGTYQQFRIWYQKNETLFKSNYSRFHLEYNTRWADSWKETHFQKFIKYSSLQITYQNHKEILSQYENIDQINRNQESIDYLIYIEWIKYCKINQTKAVEEMSTKNILFQPEFADIFNFSTDYQNNINSNNNRDLQNFKYQNNSNPNLIQFSDYYDQIRVIVEKTDDFNFCLGNFQNFCLGDPIIQQNKDLNFIKFSTVKLPDNQQPFLLLTFENIIRVPLYYQVFRDELQENDTYLINTCQITFTVLSIEFCEQTQLMHYTLQFNFKHQTKVIYCEIKQAEGEKKRFGRYLQQNQDSIFDFNSKVDFSIQNLNRDFAIFEVKNKKLFVQVSSGLRDATNRVSTDKKKHKLWKKIKQNNLILKEPFINIKYSVFQSLTIVQALVSQNMKFQKNDPCGHMPITTKLIKLQSKDNRAVLQNLCYDCQFYPFQIQNFRLEEGKIYKGSRQEAQIEELISDRQVYLIQDVQRDLEQYRNI